MPSNSNADRRALPRWLKSELLSINSCTKGCIPCGSLTSVVSSGSSPNSSRYPSGGLIINAYWSGAKRSFFASGEIVIFFLVDGSNKKKSNG
jgi:hypothetical protein